MASPSLVLELLPDPLSICRLAPDAATPGWALAEPFCSVTRTVHELSVICRSARVPAGTTAHDGWRALMLVGPFDFSLVGVLLHVLRPLAAAGVSVLPVATHDTDYVLVREERLVAAVSALRAAGHEVRVPQAAA